MQTIQRNPRQFKQNNPKKRSSGTSFMPAAIALVLIVAISGLFYFKRMDKDKKELEKRLAQAEAAKQSEQLQVPTVSPKEVSRRIRDNKYQIVDIRENDEFVLKHIEASINVPLSELQDKTNVLSKDKTIVLVDRQETGNGKVLTQHLIDEGLTVEYLEGGILNYANEGYNLINIGNPLIQSDLLKVTSYTAKELIDLLLEGSRIKFIDTRPEIDYAIDHLEGSINIPLEDIEKKKDKLPVRTFAVFDKDPIRSFQAAVRLYDMNVIGVYNCKDTYQDLKNVIDNLGKEEPTQNTEEKPEE